MLEELSDEELIRRVGRGDRDALAALYDRHARRLFHLALRCLGDRGRAEEVVQDVFMRVWRAATAYDASIGLVSTWMFSICRNAAVDRLRSERRSRAMTTLDQLGERPDEASDVPRAVERRAESESVKSALTRLPPEQRQVIELMYFQGFTQSQIAEAFKIPEGTVKGRARLALAKLRREFDPLGRGEVIPDA